MRLILLSILISIGITGQAQKNKIYFVSGKAEVSTKKNIGVISPDGSDYEEVTFSVSGRSEYQPHISADGLFMTFNTYRYSGWKIAISNSDGSNVRKLTKSNNYEYDASWSANGKIVLVGFQNGNSGKRQLYLVDPETREKTLVTNGKNTYYSPSFINNSELVFSMNKGGYYGIYTINIHSKKQCKLLDSPDYHEISPKMSPDGKLLAYHRVNENSEVELVIYDLLSKENKVIYNGWNGAESLSKMETPFFPFTISWSPSSEQLVFTSLVEPGNYELVRINKNGENRKRLTFNSWSDIQPHWTK